MLIWFQSKVQTQYQPVKPSKQNGAFEMFFAVLGEMFWFYFNLMRVL